MHCDLLLPACILGELLFFPCRVTTPKVLVGGFLQALMRSDTKRSTQRVNTEGKHELSYYSKKRRNPVPEWNSRSASGRSDTAPSGPSPRRAQREATELAVTTRTTTWYCCENTHTQKEKQNQQYGIKDTNRKSLMQGLCVKFMRNTIRVKAENIFKFVCFSIPTILLICSMSSVSICGVESCKD